MSQPFSIGQRTRAATGGKRWDLPAAQGHPGTYTDIRVGDVFAAAPTAATGYPAISSNTTIPVVGGANQSNPYTIQAGDVGASTHASQTILNALGATSIVSPSVTITPQVFFSSLRGCTVDAGGDSTFGWFMNAVSDSRGPGIQSSNAFRYGYSPGSGISATLSFSATTGACTATFSSSANGGALTGTVSDIGRAFYLNDPTLGNFVATITSALSTTQALVTITGGTVVAGFAYQIWLVGLALDSNGYPTGPSEWVINALAGDGVTTQLASGTYWGTFTSTSATTYIGLDGVSQVPVVPNMGTSVSAGTGSFQVTLDNVTQTLSGGVYTTVFRVQSALNTTLWFTGTMGGFVINRTPGLTSYQAPATEFVDAVIAYHAQYYSLRCLGLNNAIGSDDTTWSSRVTNWACVASQMSAGGFRQYAWEVWVRLVNTIFRRSGSALRMIWVQPGLFVQTVADGTTTADDYGRQLATLLTAQGLDSSLNVEVEIGNEAWNTSSKPNGLTAVPFDYMGLAQVETKLVTNWTNTNAPAVAALTSLASNGTTATATISALPSYLTVGNTYQGFVYSADALWTYGSPSSLITFTVATSTTITWPTTQIGGGSTAQTMLFLNGASDLLGDNNTTSTINLSYKWYTRTTFRMQQSWSAIRPQDKFKLCLQQFGTALTPSISNGGTAKFPIHWTYGDWLGQTYLSKVPYQGLKAWCYAAAVAPYMQVDAATAAAVSRTDQVAGLNTAFGTSSDTGTGSVWGCLLNLNQLAIRSLVYMCVTYGLRPQAYEANMDVSNLSNVQINGGIAGQYQILMAQDARSAATLTSLLTIWFESGGKEFHFLDGSPNAWAAGKSAWSIIGGSIANASASPRYNAYFSFSVSETYATTTNQTPDVSKSTMVTLNSISNTTTHDGLGVSVPTLYRVNSTLPLQVDVMLPIPRGGPFTITPQGSTNAAFGTEVCNVYLDNPGAAFSDNTRDPSFLGSSFLPNNGACSGAVLVGSGTPISFSTTTGMHTISFRIPSGQGAVSGVSTMPVVLNSLP